VIDDSIFDEVPSEQHEVENPNLTEADSQERESKKIEIIKLMK
jgi:hypothetical protein